ncbi:MAG: CoA transferase [Acidimicrobiia bacterium]|nr:CoA transferase [Acidimicrobiia bacterium]
MRPLEDIRILAVEQYGAGPFGTMHLADLGAEVIKVEDPRFGGDVGRYVPPFQDGEDSLFFETFNRNKRSISLDLSAAAGRAVFDDLVRVSDVVYSNLRGDVPQRLGLRFDDLKHLNPSIVCVSLSGFGMTGPRRSEPGYDYILQALAGWMSLTGEPEGPPAKSGLSLVDYSGGFVAALSLMAGLHAARRDGVGLDCDVSLYDIALSMLTYPAVWHMNGGFLPERTSRSAHPSLVPFQAFRAADGWFVVGCAKEKFWQQLVGAIGQDHLLEDERFNGFEGRRQHRPELEAILDDVFAEHGVDHWIDMLGAAGVPCGPVQGVPEALADPHTAARGLVVETEHPTFGTVRQMASPVRVGDPDEVDYRRAPQRNEDGDAILDKILGYDTSRVTELAAAGAFGEERHPDGL